MKTRLLFLLLGVFSFDCFAEVNKKIQNKIIDGLKEGRPDVVVDTIKESEISGIYKVSVKDGPVLYSDAAGKYFILGEMYGVLNGQVVNITEKEKEADRVKKFAQLDESKLIKYGTEKDSKGHIYVFTDVACPNCRRFHKEFLPTAAERGVEVRYLAYPIIGGEDSRKRMISAWCEEDKKEALTKLKNGEALSERNCDSHPVNEHLKLGRELQISGTPAVFLPNGERVNLRYLEQTIIRYFAAKN